MDFQSWLEAVIFNDEKAPLEAYFKIGEGRHQSLVGVKAGVEHEMRERGPVEEADNGDSKNNEVRGLVSTLLDQWRSEIPSETVLMRSLKGMSQGSDDSSSKAESRFLRRISDLVVNANEKCSQSVNALRAAELAKAKIEMSHTIISKRLETCVHHLHIYRKRAHASEAIINTDFKHGLRTQSKLNVVLSKSLESMREKWHQAMGSLLEERRERQFQALQAVDAENKVRIHASKVTELESKGSQMLRAKEEALESIECRIDNIEESTKKWLRSELPLLIRDISSATLEVELGLELKLGEDAVGTLGLDQTSLEKQSLSEYTLAEALCISKSLQSSQQAKLTALEERNFILKEKITSLQGVLEKWQNEMKFTLGGDTTDVVESIKEEMKTVIRGNFYNEKRLTEQVKSLSEIVVSLEEEIVQGRSKYEHAIDRADELQKLLDIVVDDEQLLKSKTTEQFERFRLELENSHSNELREMRESYEVEKVSLQEELSRLSAAFDEMNRTALAATEDTPIRYHLLASDEIRMSEIHASALPRQFETESALVSDLQVKIASLQLDLISTQDLCQSFRKEKEDLETAILAANNQSSTQQSSNHGDFTENLKKKEVEYYAHKQEHSKPSGGGSQSRANRTTVAKSPSKVASISPSKPPSAPSFPRSSVAVSVSSNYPPPPPPLLSPTSATTSVNNDTRDLNLNSDPYTHPHVHNIEFEVSKEDSQLWPHHAIQISELIEQLSHSVKQNKSDLNLRAAIANAFRLKASVNNMYSSTTPSAAGTGYREDRDVALHHMLASSTAQRSRSSTLETLPSTHTNVATDTEIQGGINDLAGQLKRLGNEFHEMKLPERYFKFLKELNGKAAELKIFMESELEKNQMEWSKEKVSLLDEISSRKSHVDQLVQQHTESLDSLRRRYELTLAETQEALEQQTNAARAHIDRLDDVIQQSQVQNSELKGRLEAIERERKQQSALTEVVGSQQLQAESQRVRKELTDEFYENLMRARKDQEVTLLTVEKQYKEATLENLKLAQDLSRSEREMKERDAQHAQIKHSLEEQLRNLEFHYESKSHELNNLLQSQSSACVYIDQDEADENAELRKGIEMLGVLLEKRKRAGVADEKSLPSNVPSKLATARLKDEQNELERLNNTLIKERMVTASSRAQIGNTTSYMTTTAAAIALGLVDTEGSNESSNITNGFYENINEKAINWESAEKIDFSAVINRWVGKTYPGSNLSDSKPILSKIIEFRGAAISEIASLKHSLRELNDRSKGELNRLQASVNEQKELVVKLREEMTRKGKIMASLKTAKMTDENSSEQWRNEVKVRNFRNIHARSCKFLAAFDFTTNFKIFTPS